MNYLLYCIFRSAEHEMPRLPRGVEEQPVLLVNEKDLSAAVSWFPYPELVPNVRKALAYEAVVEWLFRYHTVIPMRCGCLFQNCRQIRQLLGERRQEFLVLLGELDGLVEMGIRIRLDSASEEIHNHALCVSPRFLPLLPRCGAAYLTARREHYAVRAGGSSQLNEIANRICAQLSGVFVRSRAESTAGADGPLLSLYFLVPSMSVESFSQAVRSIPRQLPCRLLLTGPWPPYNFVNQTLPCK